MHRTSCKSAIIIVNLNIKGKPGWNGERMREKRDIKAECRIQNSEFRRKAQKTFVCGCRGNTKYDGWE
jgi:hypothetical protein